MKLDVTRGVWKGLQGDLLKGVAKNTKKSGRHQCSAENGYLYVNSSHILPSFVSYISGSCREDSAESTNSILLCIYVKLQIGNRPFYSEPIRDRRR